eukprot:2836678-Prymnesium_polylepis.2
MPSQDGQGWLTFPPPPTKPYCRSRGQEARGLLCITALTQRGCKRTEWYRRHVPNSCTLRRT